MKKQLNFKTLTTVGVKLSSKKDIKKFYKYAWKHTAGAKDRFTKRFEIFDMNRTRKTAHDKIIVLMLVGSIYKVMSGAKDAVPLKDALIEIKQ